MRQEFLYRNPIPHLIYTSPKTRPQKITSSFFERSLANPYPPWPMTALNGEIDMTQLPETGFLRLRQIIGDPNSKPPSPPLIPVKKSCWWQGVKSGRFPRPLKLGPRITVWRVEDIRDLIVNARSGGQNVC